MALRHRFVAPATGETVSYVANGIDKPFFAKLLAAFAQTTGAGRDRIILLQLDNAGWHTPENLPVPAGVTLAYLPAYSPELQPAERLWPLVDEPVVNKHFATIHDLDHCRWPAMQPPITTKNSSPHTPASLGGQNP